MYNISHVSEIYARNEALKNGTHK